jgi:hypothetical protein
MPESSARRQVCDDVRLLASADPDAVGSHTDRTARVTTLPLRALSERTVDDVTLRLGVPTRRDFVSADGTQWCVHERDASGMAHARGARCLVFETGNVLRVVWNYPRDWRTLDDAALETLSRSR